MWLLVWLFSFIGSWVSTAGMRDVVSQSYWAVVLEIIVSLNWWASMYFCKDWKDYKKLIPVIIIANVFGVSLGIKVP